MPSRPPTRCLLPAVFAAASLVVVAPGAAHAPTTSIGRAVEAFGSVPVSYEPGAAVTDIEAGRFPLLVGSNPKVAFMAASASSELAGGPNAIADEIAQEASLDGTLVVLVGTKLGAWSADIGDERLAELVRTARTEHAGAAPLVMVDALVRSVQAEPARSGSVSWALIGAALFVFGTLALAALGLFRERPAR